MAARRLALAATLSLLASIGASPAAPSAARCGDVAGSDGSDEDAVCALQHGTLKKEAVAVTHEGFGVVDAATLNYAMNYLDKLPGKEAFDAQVGWTGLPLTIAFVNDKAVPMTWDSMEEMDGNIFDEPELGTKIMPGQIVTVQMYAASDGLKGRARMRDPMKNWLSVAWQSYRVGSFSCDRLRVRAMKTKNWAEPAGNICTTDEAGIFRRNDYEVIVSLKRAE